MFRVIAFACFLSFAHAIAVDDTVAVSRNEVSNLKELMKRLQVTTKRLADETFTPEVIPNPAHRLRFKEGMLAMNDVLWSPGGMDEVVERILKSPPVSESGVPIVSRYDLKGFFVVGKVDSQDSATASRAHQAECDGLAAYLSAKLAPYFDSFSCGSTSNVSQYASIGYKQYGSVPTATLRFPAGVKVKTREGDQLDGTVDDKDAYEPYLSWLNVCKAWIDAEKAEAGDKFLGASCGLPQNLSKFGSQGYKRFVSRGTLVLKD